jgi:hypothetical protein
MEAKIGMLKDQRGSSAIFTVILTTACIFIVLALFDLCCIYIVREDTRAVSEAIALYIAQEMLFFRQEGLDLLAENMARKNNCRLRRLTVGYEQVEVSVEKEVKVAILKMIGLDGLKTVCSSSCVKVIYPWDRELGLCDYYKFSYKLY